MTAVSRARSLYLTLGAPMIKERFPAYEGRIAAGFAGEGSDCFGFDDDISRDHDYGPGFCLWLSEGDYARIGEDLNRAYRDLIRAYCAEHPEEAPSGYDPRLAMRRGAHSIRSYYQNILHVRVDEEHFDLSDSDWLNLDEAAAATAVNGTVFRDDAGLFTGIRNTLLAYYPERVWKRRLIHELREFSQYAQSNYARCMARGDRTTALICRAKAAESAFKLLFLLNRRFAPYYKWLRRAAGELPGLSSVCGMIDRVLALPDQAAAWEGYRYDAAHLNPADAVETGFEEIAAVFAKELAAQQLIAEGDARVTFLDYLAGKMAAAAAAGQDEAARKKALIAEVVRHEWQQFDRVNNQGGRADCQDDWKTFEIMRTAQYRQWDTPVLESYLKDLKAAEEAGWNLVTEKYARMMQHTDPAGYAALKDRLPARSAERLAAQEEVIAVHVAWNEAMAAAYPRYSGGGRPLHTAEDTPYETSSETYLRGELSTYSDATFALYRDMVLRKKAAGENLVEQIAGEQVKQYGYGSLEEVERRLRG